jgi:hypothetical protein
VAVLGGVGCWTRHARLTVPRYPSEISFHRDQRGDRSEDIECWDREQDDQKDPGEHDCLHQFDVSNLSTIAKTAVRSGTGN